MTGHSDGAAAGASWYRIDLTAEDYAGGEADVIEGAFRAIYIACNAPLGMAMLGAPRAGGDGYSVYFTPDSWPHARALLRAYAALPDQRPRGVQLSLRVGDAALALGYARAF